MFVEWFTAARSTGLQATGRLSRISDAVQCRIGGPASAVEPSHSLSLQAGQFAVAGSVRNGKPVANRIDLIDYEADDQPATPKCDVHLDHLARGRLYRESSLRLSKESGLPAPPRFSLVLVERADASGVRRFPG